MLSENGKTVGSALIGQRFTRPEYFHARPSAAGNDGYDGMASQGSNFGPTNKKLVERVQGDIGKLRTENAGWNGPIPADAVTASGSGLDPQISPAFAQLQTARVAAARHLDAKTVQELVDRHTQPRTLGFLGEPAVNVLELNLELDRRQAR